MTTTPTRSRRSARAHTGLDRRSATPVRRSHRAFIPNRLGSQQQTTSRGRRLVVTHDRVDPTKVSFAWTMILLLAAGVVGALVLSGVTTTQTFEIQKLKTQATQLDNQLESLGRDVQSAQASADIARRASDLGMVVADIPGVINVADDGRIDTVREPDPVATRPIIDVNGQRIRPSRASSDPQETAALGDSLSAVPRGLAPVRTEIPAVAPYAPNVRSHTAGGASQ